MANYYVRSAAAGTADGSTWANAYTTLAAAFTARAAGDTFWLADDHAETQGSAMTLTSPGTAVNPCRIIATNTHVTQPPTATATSATISTTGAFAISFAGWAYSYGVSYSAGSGGSNASIQFNSATSGWTIESGSLKLNTTNVSARISMTVTPIYLELKNTTMSFGSASQSITCTSGRLVWSNTASAILGTAPTTLFVGGSSAKFEAYVFGVDLSALGSGNLVSGGITTPGQELYYFRDCKLGSSAVALTGTIPGPGSAIVYLENCDSGNTNYRLEHYKFQGSIKNETTKIRTTGGATDGTTAISHNITTLASGPTLFSPLEGPWIKQWNETTGSSITITVEICTENVSLFDDECWLEVEYLGTSGFPQSILTSNRMASTFATHAALTTAGAPSWSGFTTAAAQRLSLSFTPRVKGVIRARVCVAKVSTSVYVDPQITVTSGPTISRSYLDCNGSSINELSTGGTRSIFGSPVIKIG